MGNVVFETAGALTDLGHEVVVFTPGYYGREEIKPAAAPPERTHAAEVTLDIDRVRRLRPSIQYGNAARLHELRHELETFDLVHLHYPFFGSAGIVRRWKKRHPEKPLVVTYHMDTRSPGWKGLIFSLYAKWFLPKIVDSADLMIASSLDYVESGQVAGIYARTAKKWVDIPFGVNTDRFMPRKGTKLLLSEYGLNPNVPTVIFVGGMDDAHYFKGIEVLLKAIFLLRRAGSPVQALLVGDGNRLDQYSLLAEGLGITDSVSFAGGVSFEQLPYCYNAADVLILPSITRGEAFGMVLLEAMASGTPVIASDLPGVRMVARDGGYLVPPKDARALADAIADCLSRQDRSIVGADVRRIAVERYSWPIVTKQLLDQYEYLL